MSVVLFNCPRGHGVLASNDTRSFRYHSCEQCSGYWIPGRVLDRVLLPGSIEELRSAPSSAGQLNCPACRTKCQAVTLDGCVLDQCLRCHGVWLDGGELQRVKRLFRSESPVVLADDDRQRQEEGDAGGGVWWWLMMGS
jgi:Zn-finger nucleic acid-binding protein